MENKAKQKHRKNGSKVLYYAALIIIAIIVLVICSLTVLFHINNIYVTGDEVPYTQDEIVFASGIETDTNIIMENTSDVSQRVASALPYIESVEPIKHFPFEIELKVTASEIIGQAEGAGIMIIDRTGRCIDRTDVLTKNVAVIRGTGVLNAEVGKTVSFGNDSALSNVVKMHDAFKKAGITDITVYNISDENKLCATYQNRIVINFGTSDNLDEKLEYAVQIIEQQKSGKQTGVLNLSRIPNDKQYAYFSPETLDETQVASVLE